MPISTLSTLLKSLGTFFTKYYPYKKFVNSLCHAYSLIGKQFETTLDDLKYDFIETVRLCYYKLDKKEDHLPVGINCYLSNDFYYITEPFVGDTRGVMYSIEKPELLDYSENIIDFKLVADGILAPQNIEYEKIFNKLFFYKPHDSIWLHECVVKYRYNNIFDVTSKQAYISLLQIYRFGLTEKLLKEYFEAISEGTVKVSNYTTENYYYDNNQVVVNKPQMLPCKWGLAKLAFSKWGHKNFIYNSYIKKDKVYYIVNIYGDKSIQYDKNIIPYWVTLNVIINKNISDKYVCNGVQSVDINIGVKLNANSSHAKHSFYTISKWGYIKFGASKFNTPIGQNLVKIFRSYI